MLVLSIWVLMSSHIGLHPNSNSVPVPRVRPGHTQPDANDRLYEGLCIARGVQKLTFLCSYQEPS
jgi:hypothetical protein